MERFKIGLFLCGCLVLLSSCAIGPPRWTGKLSAQLDCGMTTDEVNDLAREFELRLNPQRQGWRTHIILRENTFRGKSYIKLEFTQKGLQSSQSVWDNRFASSSVGTDDRRFYCE